MKVLELLGMAAVDCPGLTCIEQGWQDDCCVYLQFGLQADSPAFSNI